MYKCVLPSADTPVSLFRIIHYSLYIIPLITLWITVEKRGDNPVLIHTPRLRSRRLGISTAFCNQ